MRIKILSSLIIVCIIMSSPVTYANECSCGGEDVHRTKRFVAEILQSFDFVRNVEKWDCNDLITRRDAFKMVYIMINRGRDYIVNSDRMQWFLTGFLQGEAWKKIVFEDIIEGEDDYYFAASLFFLGILSGKEDDGKRYVDFDNYLTYEEATSNIIRTICYSQMSNADFLDEYLGEEYEGNRYFGFLEKAGLINHNAYPDPSCLVLKEDQMQEYISAYDYMFLLYRAMFIPGDDNSISPSLLGYRIMNYVNLSDRKTEWSWDIMD